MLIIKDTRGLSLNGYTAFLRLNEHYIREDGKNIRATG